MSENIENIRKLIQVGGIAETNAIYTDGFFEYIHEKGFIFDNLTIAQLLVLHQEYSEIYNRLYS